MVACRVADTLIARGHHGVIVSPDTPTTTAVEAARALGAHPSAITTAQLYLLDNDPVLLLVAAHHQVDPHRTGPLLDGQLTRCPPALAERVTGQPLTGTAPLGHPTNLPTWVDTALAAHREIWAAGGHPSTVFRTTYRELIRITAGLPLDIE
ncbi:prolyl-tRNA editing enzyme YbaK/EbsC (Cys-tRNA(Pro) deacylase) [Nocardia caishijiensis]|uniref:Prolyl-tRNA editing enzyme YbaK/EbsC (Cys-tRNA(Pro) deacylase) n=2 Tax=Nocardia caishijiensis TaxID=184756 RepID=A0ABQ6YF22_9NOCA|nr:prolyl-tRNA editing enzyme YbaK/EbsC (Cys-tRNA(Pro) deacylase) [Nocardia caishijiensis]